MWTLRYVAWISPSGPMCSDVLRKQVLALDALGDRARDELDAELAAPRPRPRDCRAVERLSAGAQVLAAPEHAPLLGQHDELRAVGRGRAREAVGALEVAVEVGGAGQLDGGDAHGSRLQD